MKPLLTVELLREEAESFAKAESTRDYPELHGFTDGKTIGTHVEHKFQAWLDEMYSYEKGSSATGIDFPSLNVDIKVTNIAQPQSSSPFESARQKILGLGHSLLIFVYEKNDDSAKRTGNLTFMHVIFVDSSRTADFQTTKGVIEIIEREGNTEDLVAFMTDRNLPIDESEAMQLAEELLKSPPNQGYLTISNAFQWRLQYGRTIENAGAVTGIHRII